LRSIPSIRSATRSRKRSFGTRRFREKRPTRGLWRFSKRSGSRRRSAAFRTIRTTTALDATVQIQILLLIRELQKEYGLSVIFVTHDIGVAAEVADRVAVMYAGRIVEEGTVADIIKAPKHPYTKGLLGARVELADGRDRLVTIPGSPPDLANMPPGCAFAPRCPQVFDACHAVVPPLIADPALGQVACLRYAS
jgi:peptide/nickel transport system ATP-binding protein